VDKFVVDGKDYDDSGIPYSFAANTDGILKVWLNRQPVFMNRASATQDAECVSIKLLRKFYPIQADYIGGTTAGGAVLLWSSPFEVKQPVPAKCLYPVTPDSNIQAQTDPNSGQNWTPLILTEFKSAAGAKGTIDAGGIVMVTGGDERSGDVYTLKAAVPAGIEPKAIRLEVLHDRNLAWQQGAGRAGSGNFSVNTFGVTFGPPGSTETPTSVPFAGAKATHLDAANPVEAAIDDKPMTGWSANGGTGKNQSATFTIAPAVNVPADATLTITIDQRHPPGHTIRQFRVAVSRRD
jgi:hypothetical protein